MPHLFPPVADFNDISNDGEREVLVQLMEQLPKEARIYHNFDLLTAEFINGGGASVKLEDGEIDAIVVLPDRSIVVVEVKGRGLRYRHDNNQWQRNKGDRWLPEDSPFKQARSNAHRLINCLAVPLGRSAVDTLRYGYIVVFPFSQIQGALTHYMQPAVY